MNRSTIPGLEPNIFPAAVYPTRSAARERSTVLLAKGVDHWVAEAPEGFALYVEGQHLDEARTQIEAYDAEQGQAAAREAPPVRPHYAAGWKGMIVAAVVLICIFQWQKSAGTGIEEKWCRDSTAIFDRGEWWRLGTALLLHADVGHLAGNILFGAVFGGFVAWAFGPWLGWSMVLLCGVLGNLATAWVWHPDPYRGIGASTAVFGAVGLLVGHGLHEVRHCRGLRQHRAWLLPLGGGLALLGFFGAGDGKGDIDLAAHLFGFLWGLPLGLAGGFWQERRLQARAERYAG
jgi:membrane associated rhomboid family serine protease